MYDRFLEPSGGLDATKYEKTQTQDASTYYAIDIHSDLTLTLEGLEQAGDTTLGLDRQCTLTVCELLDSEEHEGEPSREEVVTADPRVENFAHTVSKNPELWHRWYTAVSLEVEILQEHRRI